MKLYNHISTWAFAGLLAFTGCSQEESLEGSSSLQGFQISVTDAGFQNLSEGRATDENFKTTFVKGDAIGVYAVENGQVVEGVANRKFTMNEKENGTWKVTRLNMTASVSRTLLSMRIILIRQTRNPFSLTRRRKTPSLHW